MASFPRTEPKIAELAQVLAAGLEAGQDDFPGPPIGSMELQALLDSFNKATTAVIAAEALVSERRSEKDDALARLIDAMKADLRYAEIMVRKTPEKLTLVGWGPRRPRTPLAPPGEVRGMRAMEQGDTWITLDWRAPVDGGAPAAYRIQRRTGKGRSWDDAGTVVETEHRMTDQPRGIELSYRVVAINRAGTGSPSALATAVL